MFTRVIADKTRGFDRIKAGYHGPLYLRSARARSHPGAHGLAARTAIAPWKCLLDGGARALHARERSVDDAAAEITEAIAVSVDLAALPSRDAAARSGKPVVACAKHHTGLIDVECRAGYESWISGSRSIRATIRA